MAFRAWTVTGEASHAAEPSQRGRKVEKTRLRQIARRPSELGEHGREPAVVRTWLSDGMAGDLARGVFA